MNPSRYLRLLAALLFASGLFVAPILRAEDQPKPPTAAEPPVAPAATAEPEKAVAAPAAAAEVTPPATPTKPESPAVEAEKSDDEAEAKAAESAPSTDSAATTATTAPAKPARHKHRGHASGEDVRFTLWGDSSLSEGEKADTVISIVGSSTSAGQVAEAVVSVLGGSRVTGGEVGDSVVSVLGNTYINGHVRGEVVTVLGNVEFGPKAVVDGDVACVGGQVKRDEGAVLKGELKNIAMGGHHFNMDGLTTWFSECLRYARPLAFDRNLLWAWGLAIGFLVFYTMVALAAPAGVNKCVQTFEERPGASVLAAIFTMLLTPIAYILLVFTLALAIGFVLIPLFSTGLFFAAIFGKVVMLAWLGRRFTRYAGNGALAHPAAGVLVGGMLMLLIYTIPFVGFIAFKLIGFLGLGVVVYTLILQSKANRAARAAATPAPAPKPAPVAPAIVAEGAAAAVASDVPPPVAVVPPVISAATLPRVGFWLRIAASFLDAILVGILCGMLSSIWNRFGSGYPLWYAAYCVVMWGTKGTTIGGVICGLKLVRLDDRPVDFSIALVRALGGFLSMAVAALGFIWVAFDDDRQSWHDKIAGTTIVRVPKGTPLL